MPKIYEDHLYYPVVLKGRIVEMTGRDLNRYEVSASSPANITERQWQDLLARVAELEERLNYSNSLKG